MDPYHAWSSSGGELGCPAYAGMDPLRFSSYTVRLPRLRGDGPPFFVVVMPLIQGLLGCPAYAGMDPENRLEKRWTFRLIKAAPPTRGWTRIVPSDRQRTVSRGCPAYAGMDPVRRYGRSSSFHRLPRLRGDGPSPTCSALRFRAAGRGDGPMMADQVPQTAAPPTRGWTRLR